MSPTIPPPAKRRGRPRRGSETLTRERVLRAALDVIDEDGLDSISMRKVARRLSVDPMSLYNHVNGKEAILDGIAELLLAKLGSGQALDGPKSALDRLAREFRTAMLEHPRAAPIVLTRQLDSLTALAPIEAALTPMLARGYSAAQAVHILRMALAFLVGTLMREVDAGPTFSSADHEGSAVRRADLEASGLPAVTAAAAQLSVCDHEQEFEFGLRLLLDAIDRLPPDGAPGWTPVPRAGAEIDVTTLGGRAPASGDRGH
ncbi:TetR/AcrR family transcriptional regulator C-terminal domain-containing protein [Gordonia alkanivorans]|uniref:TetR/AcrR family transcriptional regulator C-terminal domain-containing protein n=1 Tax=Gordonia alkanivorans TaxID=84096 RepID=UPI001E29B0D2|nr:TetR/AcrR family transcriptional regulator C-terminal domain-containing protein [Gordonia alkanivorans]